MSGVIAAGLTSENQRRQQGLCYSDPNDQHPRDPRSYFHLTGLGVVTQIVWAIITQSAGASSVKPEPDRRRRGC
jgi:hypothetical protein